LALFGVGSSRKTTSSELLERHPAIAAEIEQEIKEHKWGKDV
jgi:hypothetical protein